MLLYWYHTQNQYFEVTSTVTVESVPHKVSLESSFRKSTLVEFLFGIPSLLVLNRNHVGSYLSHNPR